MRLDGILLVDKAPGLTSARVISRLKHRFKIDKIGHTGTLDPMATGLLVIVCGEATKLQSLFLGGEKEYMGQILLGVSTDTEDVEGRICERKEIPRRALSEDSLKQACQRFSGEIAQVPPVYSALKVDGARSYALARQDKAVALEERRITIHALSLKYAGEGVLDYHVRCSKGTYVRSLARDIGIFLGTLGCLKSIRRTYTAPFSLAEAKTLEALEDEQDLAASAYSLGKALSSYPKQMFDDDEIRSLKDGKKEVFSRLSNGEGRKDGGILLVFDRGHRFHGLLKISGDGWKVGFLCPKPLETE